jgi:hypothetical protein
MMSKKVDVSAMEAELAKGRILRYEIRHTLINGAVVVDFMVEENKRGRWYAILKGDNFPTVTAALTSMQMKLANGSQ